MARRKAAKITKPASSSSSANGQTRHRRRLATFNSSNASIHHVIDALSNTNTTPESGPSYEQVEENMYWDLVNQGRGHTDHDAAVVENQRAFGTRMPPRGKGKGRLIEVEQDAKPFPIMELPPEIRLEIYRACLTRPRKIMLSKIEKQSQPEEPGTEVYYFPGSNSDEVGNVDGMNEQSREDSRPHLPNGSLASRNDTSVNSVSNSRPGPSNQPRTWVLRNNRSSRSNLIARTSSAPATVSSQVDLSMYTGTAHSNVATAPTPFPTWNFPKYKQHVPDRPKAIDPLVVNILRTSKQIYKEARDVLYSENVFDLDISTAVSSLAALHQRSRRHIKHVEVEIPTYTEILERFSEVVRLSLRYCAGLQTLVIHTPFTLPGADGFTSANNTTVYANGFDILRWLPQHCHVRLEGCHNLEIDAVVNKHLHYAKTQDKAAYAHRMFDVPQWDRLYAYLCARKNR